MIEHLLNTCPFARTICNAANFPLKCDWFSYIQGVETYCPFVFHGGWSYYFHKQGHKRAALQLTQHVKMIIREKVFTSSYFQKKLTRFRL